MIPGDMMRLRWMVLITFLARAVVAVPVDEQLDVGSLQPLVDTIRPLIIKASLLVGGIFGIYIILLAFRVYYERRNQILLEHIRYDLDQLNKHQGIPSSQERKSFFHKAIIDKIFPTHAQRKHPIAKPK